MNVEDKGNEETERGAPVKAPRQKVMQSQMFQIVDMDALVPSDHILRQLRGAMDFSRVRDWVDPLYSSHTGRPAVDPERVVKLVILSYFFNHSERELFKLLPMYAGYLWFGDWTFEDAQCCGRRIMSRS